MNEAEFQNAVRLEKEEFVNTYLSNLLVHAGIGIDHVTYVVVGYDEFVRVAFACGGVKDIYVGADSRAAIVLDVIKRLI